MNIADTFALGLPLAALSTWHVVVLVLAILLLFGGKKLPELARGLARGLRIFRDELHSTQKDVTDTLENPPPSDQQKKTDTKPPEPPQEKKDKS
jgi:sec-independent protein translocase protein TatA